MLQSENAGDTVLPSITAALDRLHEQLRGEPVPARDARETLAEAVLRGKRS